MKRKLIAASLATALALGATAVPAWAYFTDNTQATGGLNITKPTTNIKEVWAESVKHVNIQNDATSDTPVFVRARVFATSDLTQNVTGSGWTDLQADGWYYYGTGTAGAQLTSLAPGDTANELTVQVSTPTEKHGADWNQEEYEVGENYNLIVVYESIPVVYDANGQPVVDWSTAERGE